jgi:hypothetical protein
MPAGDDLAIVLFFLGAAMALALAGIQSTGWRHKLLIGVLFASATVSFVIAAGWIWIKPHAPELAAILGSVATSSVSWFVVLMFSLAVILARPQISAFIPIFRPRVRPAVSTPQQPPPIEGGDLSDLIERWSNDHFRDSAVARNTQAWSVVHKAKEDLKPLLRRALFSRFAGTACYVTNHIMTDSGTYDNHLSLVHYVGNVIHDIDLLRVFVDFSCQTQRGDWTGRERIFLAEFQSQGRDQAFNVAILTTETIDGQPGIKWGINNQTLRLFLQTQYCRARLVFKGDDGGEQYYYFIIVMPRDHTSRAFVVDQRNLEFPDEWFAEDIRPVR